MSTAPSTAPAARVSRFRLADLPPQPWRNGGGLTREILAQPSPPPADGDAWDWRVSVADNERPGPFSIFPGVERTALLLQGGALELHGETGAPVLRFGRPGDIRCLAGEWVLHSWLPHGPARLLNVMVRRGRACAELAWHAGAGEAVLAPDARAAWVLLADRGRWRVGDVGGDPVAAHELVAGEGLCLHGVSSARRLRGLCPDSALAAVALRPL